MTELTKNRILGLITQFADAHPSVTETAMERALLETDTAEAGQNIACALELLGQIYDAYLNDPGYAVTDYDNTGMLEIQRIDAAGVFASDEEAVEAAIQDGMALIPVDELPENFERRYLGWIDTPENREAIRKWCEDKKDWESPGNPPTEQALTNPNPTEAEKKLFRHLCLYRLDKKEDAVSTCHTYVQVASTANDRFPDQITLSDFPENRPAVEFRDIDQNILISGDLHLDPIGMQILLERARELGYDVK